MRVLLVLSLLLLLACSASGSTASRDLVSKATAQDPGGQKPGVERKAVAAKPAAGDTAGTKPVAGTKAVVVQAASPLGGEPPQLVAASEGPTVEQLLSFAGSRTTSLGAPAAGRLRGGVALPVRGPGYYHNPKRPPEARYGTVEILQAIVRAAAVVDDVMPGSSLTVNDLGLIEGGPIPQHGSHQSGRDADILFYALDAKTGEPTPAVGVPYDPKGLGTDFKDLAVPGDDQAVKIDLPRSWRFLQALFEVAPDQVQRIFVVEHLRSLLLEEAERARAPEAIRQRFEETTCQPSTPHDDHLHVRFYCTPEDMTAGCQDSAPLYPWRIGALSALGLEPAMAKTVRTPEERAARAARTTTAAQAKKRAGPMHRKVVRFLKEREAWLKEPHPGRTYCR